MRGKMSEETSKIFIPIIKIFTICFLEIRMPVCGCQFICQFLYIFITPGSDSMLASFIVDQFKIMRICNDLIFIHPRKCHRQTFFHACYDLLNSNRTHTTFSDYFMRNFATKIWRYCKGISSDLCWIISRIFEKCNYLI